ncbi:DUF1703-domain-containing protein [Cenococcum geophilum 1.58]|uniref:DUF1703-domain-containing protein n=1 Tax=Cenococcum geophilum 1.58 TaxID=794803 RepID=UPI00358FDEAD|nr:DUF1703-domain-containing protein [Cenococcum geophilum 1.58]
MRISLHGLRVIPTSPSLRAFFHKRYHGRIQQAALVVSRTYSTAPSSSKLVVLGELDKFPLGVSNFRKIREFPGLAYFDKTSYIPVIARGPPVQLFCRPRRFGKSLTISMLQYFHGVEFRKKYDQLFTDLDVNRAVKDGKVMPGQYLVLNFDFSCTDRSLPIENAMQSLAQEINDTLLDFRLTYADYLGESFALETSRFIDSNPVRNLRILIAAVDRALGNIHDKGDKNNPLFGVKGIYLLVDEYNSYANEFMDPHNPRSWFDTTAASFLKGFWSVVKAGKKSYYGIDRVYLTGVIPLLLSNITSGFNEQENLSFSPQYSTICGLTQSDVLGALKAICNDEKEVQEHLEELKFYANSYHFCDERIVEPVFNTHSALLYLQAVKLQERPQIEDP